MWSVVGPVHRDGVFPVPLSQSKSSPLGVLVHVQRPPFSKSQVPIMNTNHRINVGQIPLTESQITLNYRSNSFIDCIKVRQKMSRLSAPNWQYIPFFPHGPSNIFKSSIAISPVKLFPRLPSMMIYIIIKSKYG